MEEKFTKRFSGRKVQLKKLKYLWSYLWRCPKMRDLGGRLWKSTRSNQQQPFFDFDSSLNVLSDFDNTIWVASAWASETFHFRFRGNCSFLFIGLNYSWQFTNSDLTFVFNSFLVLVRVFWGGGVGLGIRFLNILNHNSCLQYCSLRFIIHSLWFITVTNHKNID